jgi:glutathione S-transferase
MILIGQYDSPFVRRVGVALKVYGFVFEHRPWSTFGDAEQVAAYNPLRRVPTLVLDDGEVLIESAAILDALDELAGPERALTPRSGPQRRRAMKVCALASGAADKAVSLVYEKAVHGRTTPMWEQRCEAQIRAVLDLLETDRAAHSAPWWMGAEMGHADIIVAAVLRFIGEAHGGRFQIAGWPALAAHSIQCEAMELFASTSQRFIGPAEAMAGDNT